jgi:hypothetical protein
MWKREGGQCGEGRLVRNREWEERERGGRGYWWQKFLHLQFGITTTAIVIFPSPSTFPVPLQ